MKREIARDVYQNMLQDADEYERKYLIAADKVNMFDKMQSMIENHFVKFFKSHILIDYIKRKEYLNGLIDEDNKKYTSQLLKLLEDMGLIDKIISGFQHEYKKFIKTQLDPLMLTRVNYPSVDN